MVTHGAPSTGTWAWQRIVLARLNTACPKKKMKTIDLKQVGFIYYIVTGA